MIGNIDDGITQFLSAVFWEFTHKFTFFSYKERHLNWWQQIFQWIFAERTGFLLNNPPLDIPRLITEIDPDFNKKLSSCLFVRFLPAPGAVPDTAHDKVRFLNHHEAFAVRQAENRDVAGMELRIWQVATLFYNFSLRAREIIDKCNDYIYHL